MTPVSFLILFLVLLFFVGGWWALSYLFNPEIKDPDGFARVTGNCGDTMEIGFKFENDRVTSAYHWTDGCSTSAQCIESAARLIIDKRADDIKGLNMIHIMDEVGRLPETHVHCAQLAETTVHKALENYLENAGNKASTT